MSSAAHDLLSIHLLEPLRRAYRLARPSLRDAALASREGLRVREEAVAWSREQRREWMLARLREAVRRAAETTPYYKGLFGGIGFDPRSDFTFDDFARLPTLERADVHRAGPGLVSMALRPEALRQDATGGSTGVPTVVWLGPSERGWRESGIEHYMRRIGLPAGTRSASLWGHHLDPKASDSLGERLRAFVDNSHELECFRLSPSALDGYHAALERWRPRYLLAYANALGALAAEVAARGWRPSYPAQCFVTGAEKLTPQVRDLVQSVFGRPVHERYGSRDVGLIAFQTDPSRSLELEVDWANVLIEPETHEPVSSILVTKLYADGMPMLRYRIGDVARFSAASRPGHPAFVLDEVLGRDLDRIWLPGGRWIHGLEFPHLMKDHPVREYQVVQTDDASVTVRLVPTPGFGEDHRAGILRTLRANLDGLSVQVELCATLPRTRANKLRAVVSEIDARRRAEP
jgi:phenylacetate-coenzyme A ligase PaaK-like adenylate-forming protein